MKSLFIDIKNDETRCYLFSIEHGRFEHVETKVVNEAGNYDFGIKNSGNIDVNISLPINMLNFRVLELPFRDKERILEVLPFELEGMILGGSDKVIMDAVVLNKTDNKYKVLAVYIEKLILGRTLSDLKASSLTPSLITSIELRSVLNEFSTEKLINPVNIDDAQRIKYAIEEIINPSINLSKGEFVFKQHLEETKKGLKIASILLLLIFFTISADIIFHLYTTRSEISNIKKEIRKQYLELYPQEKNVVNEYYKLQSHFKELIDRNSYLSGISCLNTLRLLSQLERRSAIFNELIIEKGNLTLKGEADNLNDIQQIKDSLSRNFENVVISDSKSSLQNKMLFTITAQEKKLE
ncbi:MAG: hypothetical protein HXY52_01520 [Nitrospirae bacterium]|jgi:type II secretory pathway component PulL|nr:hypothetical protein [Nitrospirota bacterium]